MPSAAWSGCEADDRIDTTNGDRLRFTLQGTAENPLSDATFVQGLADAKAIHTLGGPEGATG